MICLRQERLYRLTCGYRLRVFFFGASAAESFRSRCGSVRGAPVCSSQASPIIAPQVSQGTDNIFFGVSSLVFTGRRMQHFRHGKMFNIAHSEHMIQAAVFEFPVHPKLFLHCEQK